MIGDVVFGREGVEVFSVQEGSTEGSGDASRTESIPYAPSHTQSENHLVALHYVAFGHCVFSRIAEDREIQATLAELDETKKVVRESTGFCGSIILESVQPSKLSQSVKHVANLTHLPFPCTTGHPDGDYIEGKEQVCGMSK